MVGLGTYVYLQYSGNPPAAVKKLQEKSPLDPDNFVDFKLKKIEDYNHNTAKYVYLGHPTIHSNLSQTLRYIFELPNNEASLLPVASCVIVKSSADAATPVVDDKGKPVIRPYTPISPPDLEGELTFLIKRYEAGKMSQYIHNLKPGDKLAIKGPIVKIPYKGPFFALYIHESMRDTEVGYAE